MNAYRFKEGETKPCESLIGISEQPEGFVVFGKGAEEVDWTQKQCVDGKLIDVPKPEQPAAYVPTAEELRQQRFTEINFEYQAKLRKMRETLDMLEAQSMPTDKVKAQYISTVVEYKTSLIEASK